MWKGLIILRERLERFLNVSETGPASVRIRARMLYATGFVFFLVHTLNLVSMSVVYGGWTSQHDITIAALLAIAAITLAIRYTKSPVFFGSAYALLTVGGVWIAAAVPVLPGQPPNGIESSLLPILCSSAAFIAFVGTRLVTTVYIAASALLIGGLYMITASHGGPTGMELPLAWQRAVQGWIALFLIGPICLIISHLVFRNLDSLESAVTRARQAEQARRDFLATMSHEIRTPLHGILGLSDMMSRADLPTAQKRQAELVSISANNLMEIIDEVLDMARLEDGTVTLKTDRFEPASLLQDISDLFAVKAAGKSLWIGTQIDPTLPKALIGDAPHLRQVISNLVGNAVKFTQSGGVRIGAALAGIQDGVAAVQFYVQDSGVGIAEEDQQAVFERFTQTESASTSKTKGTGLGLSICRELTDMMGGSLSLHSRPGEGTVFHFTLMLPLAEEAAVAA